MFAKIYPVLESAKSRALIDNETYLKVDGLLPRSVHALHRQDRSALSAGPPLIGSHRAPSRQRWPDRAGF